MLSRGYHTFPHRVAEAEGAPQDEVMNFKLGYTVTEKK